MSDLPEQLPSTWLSAHLSEIADINPKVDKSEIPDDLEVSFVPMPAVEELSGRMDVGMSRPFAEVKKGYTPFLEGDVLFAKITPCMENGKMAVVPTLKNGYGFGSTEFHVLRPYSGIDAKYLYYFISAQGFRADAEHNMTGAVGQRRVPTLYLSERCMPIAPSKEQRRIVAKIEELFSELDKGIEYLTTAREQLKAYRQSVLKYAFEGKLTETWEWKPLGDVSVVTGGLTKNPKRATLPIAMKYLRVANVYADRLELDDVTEIGVTEDEYEKVRLEPGDLLVVEGNGSIEQIGRVAVWNGELENVGHQNHLIRVRLPSGMLPRFILAFLMSPLGRDRIVRQASSTSGLHTLSISKVSGLQVPVPSYEQQEAILGRLDASLSGIEKQVKEVEQELLRANALRQSILKRAFFGQLVVQDATDEPASVLLERIRAERENTNAQKPAHKTKKTKNGKKEKAA